MKKTKQLFLFIFLSFHLFLIVYGNISTLSVYDTYGVKFSNSGNSIIQIIKRINTNFPDFINNIYTVYQTYTGITGYVYFSPNPPDSYKLYFSFTDTNGNNVIEMPMNSSEGNLRKLCGNSFLKEIKIEDLKDVLAKSIAARFFELRPDVHEFEMTSFYYGLPNMMEYSNGEKPVFVKDFYYKLQNN